MKTPSLRPLAGVAAFGLAAAFTAHAAYIPLKAEVAQVLISHAFAARIATGVHQAPWPGADMNVEARLTFPQRDQSHFIVSGASGRSLAFGPGRELRSSRIGEPGVSVIGGHRDTHFSLLENVRLGETVHATDSRGDVHRYRITALRVVDRHDRRLTAPTGSRQNRLVLVTCYPFDAVLPGGNLRYVVVADEV